MREPVQQGRRHPLALEHAVIEGQCFVITQDDIASAFDTVPLAYAAQRLLAAR